MYLLNVYSYCLHAWTGIFTLQPKWKVLMCIIGLASFLYCMSIRYQWSVRCIKPMRIQKVPIYITLKYKACAFNQSAMHIKIQYDVLLWFMWHFEQKLYVLLYFMLFTGHCFKNTHTVYIPFKRNVDGACYIWIGIWSYYHIEWAFLAFHSNYIHKYSIYFWFRLKTHYTDSLLFRRIPNEGTVRQSFISLITCFMVSQKRKMILFLYLLHYGFIYCNVVSANKQYS